MTDMTTKTGEGRYEIIFTTDVESAYKNVQQACRKEMGNDKPIPVMKPCPFCGGSLIAVSTTNTQVGWYGIAGCTSCGALMKGVFDGGMRKRDARIAIIDLWNKRVKE